MYIKSMSKMLVSAIVCCFMPLIGMNCNAQNCGVLPVSTLDLVESSDLVIHGIVGKVVTGKSQKTELMTTWSTIEVIECLKGDLNTKEYTFRQYGGTNSTNVVFLKTGEEIILFLPTPSPWGFSSPIGLHQGILSIKTDIKTKAKTVIKPPKPELPIGFKLNSKFSAKTSRSTLNAKAMSPFAQKALQLTDSNKFSDVKNGLQKLISTQKSYSKPPQRP